MRFINPFRKVTRPEPVSEAALVLQYRQSGDLSVLGRLYAPYMELVFGICFKYLTDEDLAKDAVMQIFEKLIAQLRTHEIDNFRAWLHSVARNHCLMVLRAQRSFADMDEAALLAAPAQMDGVSSRFEEEDFTALENCLGRLAAEQRVSVTMFYLDQKCYQQIAEENGYELTKVKSFIQNGKRNLKICMEKNGKR